jgi:exopolyphosphatase/guanosine-5'-triphosphate,3'-diphosphate pyrophosphatase
VQKETGLCLEIVSRETEARLAVAGCASLVDPRSQGVILFDIGGGSSELVWIDLAADPSSRRRRMSDRIRTWMSLPVGVVNVSERHGGRDVTPELFETMVGEVMEMLSEFPEIDALDRAVATGHVHMLGTSGTVTTLAGVHLRLPRYDRRRVDGTWLSGDQVESLIAALLAMDYEARVANPCIGRERADLVLAGCAILEAIRRRWPCKRLRVADRGLREGVLVELMAEDGVWRRRAGRRGGDRSHG